MSNGGNCDKCGAVRVPVYDKDDGHVRGWRCPNGRQDKTGCQGKTVWTEPFRAVPAQPPQGQQQARQWAKDALPKPQAPVQGNGTRERSIEAQTAIKAACELVGRMYTGLAITETHERAATEMAIRVAKRLMREVVLVAPTLQPDFAPSRAPTLSEAGGPHAGTVTPFQFTEDNPPPPEDADIPF